MSEGTRAPRDDRGVSIAVGYVLNLAIATILFSALLIGGSGLVESQTRIVTNDELSVTGQQLASELSSADRLVRAGGEADLAELSLHTELPDRTAAGGYTIEIGYNESTNNGTIELRSTNPEVVVTVPFRSETNVEETTVNGGSVEIEYNDGEDRLEVTSA